MKQEIIDKINRLASQDEPFLFVINYQGDKSFIRLLSYINPEECLFDFEGRRNFSHVRKETLKEEIPEVTWQIEPPLYNDYERSFDIVKSNIMGGGQQLSYKSHLPDSRELQSLIRRYFPSGKRKV